MNAPLRVLYLAHSVSASGGGMERVGHELVAAGAGEVDYVVVASEGLDELPAGVTGIHLALPARPAFARIAWFYLRSGPVVRRWRRRVDLVHSCGAVTRARVDLATVHLCQAAVPAVSDPTARRWRRVNAAVARAAGRRIERAQYRPGRVGTLVAVSDSVSDQLARHYPSVPRRTVANGVAVARFARPERREPRSGQLVATMVTGDFALKGVELAVRALAHAPGVRLNVVGRGDATPYLALARELAVSDRVRFTGPVADPREIYDESDVVLGVAHYEAFGLYLVEAALAGCAVVAVDVGVARELIGPGDGGMLVERDAPAVGAALNELARDRPRARAMGVCAAARAAGFSEQAMVAGYHALYRELAAR